MSVTNWDRLRKRMGPNERFPGKRVYCYGAFRRMEQQWFVQFVKEADARDLDVLVKDGLVFVLEDVAALNPNGVGG